MSARAHRAAPTAADALAVRASRRNERLLETVEALQQQHFAPRTAASSHLLLDMLADSAKLRADLSLLTHARVEEAWRELTGELAADADDDVAARAAAQRERLGEAQG